MHTLSTCCTVIFTVMDASGSNRPSHEKSSSDELTMMGVGEIGNANVRIQWEIFNGEEVMFNIWCLTGVEFTGQ